MLLNNCWRRLLRVPWTAKRSNQSTLKEIHPEYSLEGLDAEAETPILWPPDVKNWLIGKNPDAGKDWRQEEKGTTEDELVGWHHWLDGSGFGWTLGVGDEQGGQACYSSRGYKKSDMIQRVNWTELRGLQTVWFVTVRLTPSISGSVVEHMSQILHSCWGFSNSQ